MRGRLEPEAIGVVITRFGVRALLDIRPTGHSHRRVGNPDAVAEKQGGWKCAAMVHRWD